ncbi:apolipoprotein N-acyltransferase [Aquisalimonas asiatica]|nr:apolipoprotein N-acyltransferase [Aquisalimonas asiatica]
MAASSEQPTRAGLANRTLPIALAALAGLLLSLPFLLPQAFVAGWVALVPLLMALENRSLKGAWLLGLVAGLTAWASGTYWMADFFSLFKGYSAPWHTAAAAVYWLYAAQAFALAALALQWLRRVTGLSDLLLVPIVFVGVLNLFPVLFPLRPGEGQSLFLPAIQGVDLGGVRTLDLLMALAATLIHEQLRVAGHRSRLSLRLAAAGLLVAWFGYGIAALHDWRETTATLPPLTVGVVQPNDPPTRGIPPLPSGYSRLAPPELEATRDLAGAGAELVVWPEARYKGYHRNPGVRHRYHQAARELGITLAFQDAETADQGGGTHHYNTASVLGPDGAPAGHYRKMGRVPFGEYLPWADTLPWLAPAAEAYFGDFMETLTAGDRPDAIEVAGRRVIPRICYETVFPELVARGVDGAGGVLVVHSMNNWFGETAQPSMHLRTSILRAVENRVPMVHAINNGPSALVGPDGGIIKATTPFATDTLLADLPDPQDTGATLFNRYPRAVPMALNTGLGVLVAYAAACAWRRRAGQRDRGRTKTSMRDGVTGGPN